MKIDTFGILWYYQRLLHFKFCVEDFVAFTEFITGPLHLKHFLPGVLWEGTGQNSLFHGRHSHHSPELFQLPEKDRTFSGNGVEKNSNKNLR